MNPSDVAPSLRKVAALRALCLRLPHIATPAEARLLARFETLAASPECARNVDIDAIAAGWRQWWRDGDVARLLLMGSKLSRQRIEFDRRLATYWHAARARRWIELQDQVEQCHTCIDLKPTEGAQPLCRGEMPLPPDEIRVLFVGVAPTRLGGRSRGTHFYSNRSDFLRAGLFRALDRSPFRTSLIRTNAVSKEEGDSAFHRAGFFLVHAAKIRPTRDDAPSTGVLTACAKQHLQDEIQLLAPQAICFLGNTPDHLPAVARVILGHRITDAPQWASVGSWSGLAAVTAQPRRGGVRRAESTLRAIWQALEGGRIQEAPEPAMDQSAS